MARIVGVGGRMSLADALLLAGKFERVEEERDTDNSKGSGQWTVNCGQRKEFESNPKYGEDNGREPDDWRDEFNFTDGDMSDPNAKKGSKRGN